MQKENKNNKIISIALATDERYIAPTLVAVRSIVLSSKDIFDYEIFILSEKKLGYFAEKSLLSVANRCKNIEIVFITVGEKLGTIKLSLEGPVKGVTSTTYLRFLLPNVLPYIQKIIYIDVDVVVLSDIAELFDVELGECCVGAIRDVAGLQNKIQRCAELSIPDMDYYVNAGVLLMDLDKFRRYNLSDKMLYVASQKTFPYNDQDIINSICYGSILCISYRYNVIIDYLKEPTNISREFNIDYRKETEKPMILHYAGRTKPWYFPKDKWSLYWWSIVKTFNILTSIMFKIYIKRLI